MPRAYKIAIVFLRTPLSILDGFFVGKGDILITWLSPKDILLTLYLTPLGVGGGGDNADHRVQSWDLAMAELRNLTGLY